MNKNNITNKNKKYIKKLKITFCLGCYITIAAAIATILAIVVVVVFHYLKNKFVNKKLKNIIIKTININKLLTIVKKCYYKLNVICAPTHITLFQKASEDRQAEKTDSMHIREQTVIISKNKEK